MLQNEDLPATDNPLSSSDADVQSVSSTGRVCIYSTDGKSSETFSEGRGPPKARHHLPSTDKRPNLASVASKDASTLPTVDPPISMELRGQEQRHLTRSLGRTDVSLQRENLHRRSSKSTDHSRRLSSGAARFTDTRHGRSSSQSQHGRTGSRTEPESTKERSSCYSRGSSLPRDHRSNWQGCGEEFDSRSLGRLRYHPGRDNDSSCNRESVFHQLGYQKDNGSSQARETDRKKCDPYHRSYKELEEHMRRPVIRVDQKRSEDMARTQDTPLTKDLDRLSVVAGDCSEAKVKDVEDESAEEYKNVLTRHVNQLFIRGDNVALVAILG